MEQPKFETVQQVIDYLTEMKGKSERLSKRNPDFSISLKTITNLPIDLIFDLYEYMHGKDESKYVSSYNKVSKSGDHLSLYGWTKLPMPATFNSVKIKENTEPIPERQMYEPAE